MSDRDTWPANPSEPPASAKSSNSGCLKWFLILGGVGMFCMLLCCGGAAWFGFKFVPKVITNPAEVAQVAQKIMQIDVPEGFNGMTAMTIDNSYIAFQMAIFKAKSDESILQLGKFELRFGDVNKLNKQQQNDIMGQYQNSNDKANKLVIRKTETKDFEIDGKKVPFRFSEAVHPDDTNKEFRVVEAEFGTAASMRFLKFTIEAEDYDEEAVVKMIESIR